MAPTLSPSAMSDMSSSSLNKGRMSGQDTTSNIRQEQSQLSPPVTSTTSPKLELEDFGSLPFSHSFSGLFGLNHSIETDRTVGQDNPWQQIDPDVSYNIEQITNIKDFDPQWEHDEIDEVVVMKRKPKSWKISKNGTQHVTIADFDMLHSSENIGGRTISVSLGRHRQTSRLYAIKTLPFSSTKERNDARLERYIFETLKPLNKPSLPRLHWTFEHEHHVYFVTDFNPGHDLLTQITSGGRWGIERCRVLANELVSAISALHDVGIIHGDLRPESILFKSDGHLVVTDFNFSFIHDSSMRPSRLPVKNHYKAPEILLGWRYDFSVDCWAFGILLYMMLFGMPPFTNTNGGLSIKDSVLNSTTTYGPTIGSFSDSSACELVAKCLERNPAMRPKIRDIRLHSFLSPNTGRRRKMYDSRNESLKASAKFAKKIESLGVKLGSPLSSASFPRLFGRRPMSPKINVNRPLPPIPVENIEDSPCDTTVNLSHDSPIAFIKAEPGVAPAPVHREFSEDVSDKEAEKKAARDRFWETISTQNVSLSPARSLGVGEAPARRGQPSAASLRLLSVIADTSLNATSRLRKRLRPKENALKLDIDHHHRTSTPLPAGVEKIGNGIGFSHPDSSCLPSKDHSRPVTPGLGRTMLRAGLTTFRHGLGLDKLSCMRREMKREQDSPVVTCGSPSDCSSNSEVNITLPFSLAQGIDRSPTSDSFVYDDDDGSNVKFGEMITLRLVAYPNSPSQVVA